MNWLPASKRAAVCFSVDDVHPAAVAREAHAHARARRLFWFATRRPTMECEWTDGFVARLPPAVTDWELQNGDRM